MTNPLIIDASFRGEKMKKQITIGIAALLLGLILSVPLRVNALEDEKNIVEGNQLSRGGAVPEFE